MNIVFFSLFLTTKIQRESRKKIWRFRLQIFSFYELKVDKMNETLILIDIDTREKGEER